MDAQALREIESLEAAGEIENPRCMELLNEHHYRLPRGRYLYCPEGSHLAMYDDQRTYFSGLVDFLGGL